MTTPRLKPQTEQETIKTVLKAYEKTHIQPLIEQHPVLSHAKDYWSNYGKYKVESFYQLIPRTFQNWIQKYPDYAYQQLQQKAENNQCTPTEKQDIENSINHSNQQLVKDQEKINQEKQAYYKIDRNAFIKHPLKNKKPDKRRYQPLIFTEKDSPFTVSAVLEVLSNIFQTLHQQQAFDNFTDNPHLPSDRNQQNQHQQLDKQTQQLTQKHQHNQDQTALIKAKEAELERKLEQLKHLTHIAQSYNNPAKPSELTSPSQQIDLLEKLLAEKQRKEP